MAAASRVRAASRAWWAGSGVSEMAPSATEETARHKAQPAEDAWDTRDPEKVALAYPQDSERRNRDVFLNSHREIVEFLTALWRRELDYRLRKEPWAWAGPAAARRPTAGRAGTPSGG